MTEKIKDNEFSHSDNPDNQETKQPISKEKEEGISGSDVFVSKDKIKSSFINKSLRKKDKVLTPETTVELTTTNHKSHDKPETKEEIAAAKAKLQVFKIIRRLLKNKLKNIQKPFLMEKLFLWLVIVLM